MKSSDVCLENSNPHGNAFPRSHCCTSGLSLQFFKSRNTQRRPTIAAQREVIGDPPLPRSRSLYSGDIFAIKCGDRCSRSEAETSSSLPPSVRETTTPAHLGKFQEHFEKFCLNAGKDKIPELKISDSPKSADEPGKKCAQRNNISATHDGVMQDSCSASATTSTSAFLSSNIFTNFTNFIDEYNLPLGKESQNLVAIHSPSAPFGCAHSAIHSTASHKCIAERTTLGDNGMSKMEANPLEPARKFKKEMENPIEGSEKAYFMNSTTKPVASRPTSFGAAEEGRSSSNNDFETENFSSVFAKSLTSLYSSEPDNPYDNEVTMKCDVSSVGMDATNELSGSMVRNLGCKGEGKTLASDGISDHSFDSAFRHVDQQICQPANKIKLGRPINIQESSDSGRSFGEGRFSDSTFNCGSESLRSYQYDPYDVTNSFYRNREESATLGKCESERRPDLGSNPDSRISRQESDKNPPQKDSRAKAFSRKARYDVADGYSGKRIFRSMRLKGAHKLSRRALLNPGFGAQSDRNGDELAEKKMRRISALSVYAKVQDDVIMSVMCKRFKKRTKPMGAVDDEMDNCHVSVVSCTSQDGLKMTFNKAMISNHREDHFEVTSAVKTTVNNILTTLSQRNNEEPSDGSVLEEMDSATVRELVFKLCLDYSFDRRDFEDVDLVTKVNVIEAEKQEEVRRRGRKRQRSSLDKGSGTRSEASSAEATDHTPEAKNRTAIHRILRSLPSRQNSVQTRRNEAHLDTPRVLSPPTFTEDSCTLPDADNLEGVAGGLDAQTANENDGRRALEDTHVIAKCIADSGGNYDESSCQVGKSGLVMDFSEDTNDTDDVVIKEENSSMLVCPSMTPSSPVKGLDIYKPPELVRMADDSAYYDMNKEYDESNNHSESDRFSPSYLTANGIRESSETPPSEPTILQGQGDSLPALDDDDDDSEEELVIDMSYNNSEGHTNGDDFTSGPKIKTESSPILSSSEIFHHQVGRGDSIPQETTRIMESMDDDCIIIPSDDEETQESFQNLDRVIKKEIISDSALEDESNVTLEKSDLLNDQSSPTGLKKITKEERDESILRNLLLDPAENVPGVSLGGQDISPTTPVITSVISLNGMKTLCSSPNPTDEEAVCPGYGLVESTSPFLESPGVFRTPDVNHVPNHQSLHRRDTPKFPQSLHSSPLGDAKCDLRSLMQKVDVTPPRSPLPGEAKDHSWTTDPDQLKEKIKKLKNEIVYLQMMAEQKEKEKTAIICFKKYKEEILRRICKAYAYTNQGHVKDVQPPDLRRSNDYHDQHFPPPAVAQSQRLPYLPPRYSNPSMKQPPPMNIPESHYVDANQGHVQRNKSVLLASPHANYQANSRVDKDTDRPPILKPNHISGEKLPAVEAMLAEASDNYGVDMKNVKKETSSQSRTEAVNAILRKALSAKETSRAAAAAAAVAEGRWPPDSPQCHSKVPSAKANPPPQTRFVCDRDPLDPNVGRKALNVCNSVPTDLSVVHNQNGKPRFEAMVKEPQANRNNGAVYNSWNSHMNRSHPMDGRSNLRNLAPKPPAARSVDSMRMSQSFVGPRPDIPDRTPAVHPPAAPMKSSVSQQVGHHRGHPGGRTESSLNDVLDRIYSRKTEERKNTEFPPMMSTNGTMPYGGRVVRGEAPTSLHTKTTPSDTRAPRPATCPPCMGCGISDAKFLCSGCRKHWYCSPQCQSLRWPEHSQMCAGRVYAQAPGHFS